MTNARDKANIPVLNFQSKGIDDNADATAITIDSSERVGIGTTSPTVPLMVQSNQIQPLLLKGANDKQMVVETTGGSTQITSYQLKNSAYSWQIENGRSANTFTIRTNSGGERMRINSSGNVGIATSDPKEKLDSRGSAVFSGDHATSTNAYGTAHGILLSSTSNLGKITAISNGSNDVKLELRGLDGGTANSNQLVLDGGTSNVGIGTSSPSEKLEVIGRILINETSGNGTFIIDGSATSNSQIRFSQGGTPKGYVTYWDSSDTLGLTDGSANGLHFSPSNQRVGIGTTSPAQKLHISSGGTTYLRTENTGISTVTDFGTDGTGSIVINRSAKPFRIFTNSTERMRIDSSGNVGIGTTSPSTPLQVNGTARASNFNTLSTQLVMNNSSQDWDISGVIGTIANVEGSISFELTMKERNASSVQLFRVYYIRVGQGTTFNISSAVWSVGSTAANTTISYPSAGTIRFTNSSFSVLDAQIRRISS